MGNQTGGGSESGGDGEWINRGGGGWAREEQEPCVVLVRMIVIIRGHERAESAEVADVVALRKSVDSKLRHSLSVMSPLSANQNYKNGGREATAVANIEA